MKAWRLAEAMLRVPDEEAMDVLIEDEIAPFSWEHLGKSSTRDLMEIESARMPFKNHRTIIATVWFNRLHFAWKLQAELTNW